MRRWLRQRSLIWVVYKNWYVGVTNNPELRKRQHERRLGRQVRHWCCWNTGRLRTARALEHYFGFHGKGMRGGKVQGNVQRDSTWIYVFK